MKVNIFSTQKRQDRHLEHEYSKDQGQPQTSSLSPKNDRILQLENI